MKEKGCFFSIIVAIAAAFVVYIVHHKKVSEREASEAMNQAHNEKLYKRGKDAILFNCNAIILDNELYGKILMGYITKEMDFIDTLLNNRILADPIFFNLAFELKANNEIILNLHTTQEPNIVFRLQKKGKYFKFNEIKNDESIYLILDITDYEFNGNLEFTGTCQITDRAFFAPYFREEFVARLELPFAEHYRLADRDYSNNKPVVDMAPLVRHFYTDPSRTVYVTANHGGGVDKMLQKYPNAVEFDVDGSMDAAEAYRLADRDYSNNKPVVDEDLWKLGNFDPDSVKKHVADPILEGYTGYLQKEIEKKPPRTKDEAERMSRQYNTRLNRFAELLYTDIYRVTRQYHKSKNVTTFNLTHKRPQ